MPERVVIGTRRSRLALWQTDHVRMLLEQAGVQSEIVPIVTSGDKSQEIEVPLPELGGKGVFTADLETALLRGEINAAVHSLKDLPNAQNERFVIAAICERGPANDVLVSRGGKALADLPSGAVIGTSSLRRALQILRLRPDLQPRSIRGNVETRVAKVDDPDSEYQAAILAEAGLQRLGLGARIAQTFTEDEVLCAPGQGAIAIQCLASAGRLRERLSILDHAPTRAETTAERSFLEHLQAGCSAPVAARAHCKSGLLTFHGRCIKPDDRRTVEVRGEGRVEDAAELGIRMAEEIQSRGFCAADWRGGKI